MGSYTSLTVVLDTNLFEVEMIEMIEEKLHLHILSDTYHPIWDIDFQGV